MKTGGAPAEGPLTRLADDQGLLQEGVRGSIRGSSPCLHASPVLSKPHFSDPWSQSWMGCFFPHVGCWRTWLGLAKEISLVTELVKGAHLRSYPPIAAPGSGPHPHPGLGSGLPLPMALLSRSVGVTPASGGPELPSPPVRLAPRGTTPGRGFVHNTFLLNE